MIAGLQLLDWVLGGSTVAAKVLMLKKVWWAPVFGLAIQPIWITYAFLQEQYGFLITPAFMTIIYGSSVKKWWRERYALEFVESHQDDYVKEEQTKHPDWRG